MLQDGFQLGPFELKGKTVQMPQRPVHWTDDQIGTESFYQVERNARPLLEHPADVRVRTQGMVLIAIL